MAWGLFKKVWPFNRDQPAAQVGGAGRVRHEGDEIVDQVAVEIPYWLVVSRLRIRGTLSTTVDHFDGDSSSVQDVHVEMVQQGDFSTTQKLRTGAGTQEVQVTLTADGRLQSVQHQCAGAGPSVVSAGARLIGFIGGAAVKALGGGGLAGESDAPPPKAPDPREKWKEDHQDTAKLLAAYVTLAKEAANKLVELQQLLVTAPDLATARLLTARVAGVSSTLQAARAEVSRIEALYATWRTNQATTHTAALESLIDLDQIEIRPPAKGVADPPKAPQKGSLGYELWRDFRLILQVVDARRSTEAGTPAVVPPEGDRENTIVRWRVPRMIELWVWSDPADRSGITLITRAPVTVVDKKSDKYGMSLRSSSFGEHGGRWMFGDDGAPIAITTNDKSMAGALADAIGAAPEQLMGAVEQAKKLTDTINGIQDAAAEREKVAAERDLAAVKARIELLGLNATEADVGALARAEQAVKLRTATRAIAPGANVLEDLKDELDRAKTQNDLDAARRSATIEGQLVDLRAEVARLEQEVLIAKANYQKLNPDKIAS